MHQHVHQHVHTHVCDRAYFSFDLIFDRIILRLLCLVSDEGTFAPMPDFPGQNDMFFMDVGQNPDPIGPRPDAGPQLLCFPDQFQDHRCVQRSSQVWLTVVMPQCVPGLKTKVMDV